MVYTSSVEGNIAKYRNISKVSPLPNQNLLFAKLIRLYLHVHKILQVRGVPKVYPHFITRHFTTRTVSHGHLSARRIIT